MSRHWEKPEIEYGHKMPAPRKKPDMRCRKRPSPWIKYLDDLPLGTASFRVEWSQLAAIKAAARILGIEIVHEDLKTTGPHGLRMARVWRRL